MNNYSRNIDMSKRHHQNMVQNIVHGGQFGPAGSLLKNSMKQETIVAEEYNSNEAHGAIVTMVQITKFSHTLWQPCVEGLTFEPFTLI